MAAPFEAGASISVGLHQSAHDLLSGPPTRTRLTIGPGLEGVQSSSRRGIYERLAGRFGEMRRALNRMADEYLFLGPEPAYEICLVGGLGSLVG